MCSASPESAFLFHYLFGSFISNGSEKQGKRQFVCLPSKKSALHKINEIAGRRRKSPRHESGDAELLIRLVPLRIAGRRSQPNQTGPGSAD
jgi:hypothetical protein